MVAAVTSRGKSLEGRRFVNIRPERTLIKSCKFALSGDELVGELVGDVDWSMSTHAELFKTASFLRFEVGQINELI